MKTYTVELKRTSYVTITIEAESPDHADELAWYEIQTDGSYGASDDAEWTTERIEEAKQ